MGVISLPMTLGEYPRQSCMMTDFLVIDQPSAFNAVLGRSSLRELKAITSIYHLLMKFPTPSGVREVKGNQQETRQCYDQAVRTTAKLRQFHVVDQRPPNKGPLDNTIDLRSPMMRVPLGPLRI